MYLSGIKPILDYAWNTRLPKYLSDNIELIQKRALRCIYPGQLYDETNDKLHVPR